jgi:hypothetical protein
VGFFRRSDQFVAGAATSTTRNKHKRQISTPSAGFEPTIPIIKQLQTYALDSTTSGVSRCKQHDQWDQQKSNMRFKVFAEWFK